MAIRAADHKEAVLDALLQTRRKAQRLALRLALLGHEAEARRVRARARRLTREIDVLLGRALRAWAGSAAAVEAELRRANRDLQRRIAAVGRGVEIAEHAVRAAALIDDVVAIARRL